MKASFQVKISLQTAAGSSHPTSLGSVIRLTTDHAKQKLTAWVSFCFGGLGGTRIPDLLNVNEAL